MGRALFQGTTFTEDAYFGSSTFTEAADFRGATFIKNADFRGATFIKNADFRGATFTEDAFFPGSVFTKGADFHRATFTKATVFQGATFTRGGDFSGTTFTEGAAFGGTTFTKNAGFGGTTFTKNAGFGDATFTEGVNFGDATFTEGAYFDGATFTEGAYFRGATFTKNANFRGATFTKNANFRGATFTKNADFRGATFNESKLLGPLTADRLELSGAQFGTAVVIEAESGEVSCQRARFSGGVEFRIRHGRVDLSEVFLGAASSLATSATEFTFREIFRRKSILVRGTEQQVKGWHARNSAVDHRPVLTSLRGTDVSELALTDVDLRWCRFAGAHHLDKLRIEGDSPFLRPPRAWWRSPRQVLFEEHPWRASRKPTSGWLHATPVDRSGDRVEQVGPDRLAALYRSLRKALEDGKNEAGAGDFYLGEQEARRRAKGTSTIERMVLWAYWLVSGYGQRALRALVALAGVVTVVTVVLVICGLPAPAPASQSTTVTYPVSGGGQQTLTTTSDVAPQLPPGSARWTWDRVDSSARIALGAVVFRDAGQKLTTSGVWTVMVARFVGPILLALAALAVRARVKR